MNHWFQNYDYIKTDVVFLYINKIEEGYAQALLAVNNKLVQTYRFKSARAKAYCKK